MRNDARVWVFPCLIEFVISPLQSVREQVSYQRGHYWLRRNNWRGQFIECFVLTFTLSRGEASNLLGRMTQIWLTSTESTRNQCANTLYTLWLSATVICIINNCLPFCYSNGNITNFIGKLSSICIQTNYWLSLIWLLIRMFVDHSSLLRVKSMKNQTNVDIINK